LGKTLARKNLRIALFSLLLAGLLATPVAANATGSGTMHDQGRGSNWCERELDETVRDFDEAFLDRDLDRFMPYYHEDATSVATNGRVRLTKSELETSFRNLFAFADLTAEFPVLKKTIVGCHTAVLVIDFTLTVPSLDLRQHFVNTLTWVRDDGRWQVLAGVSTTIQTGAAAPATATTSEQISSSRPARHNCARKLERTVVDSDGAFLARNLNRFVGYYHWDASSVTSSGEINFTKAGIKTNVAELFGHEFTAQFPLLKQSLVNCQTAVLVRDVTMQVPELATNSHFINSRVWVHDHGRWRILADVNTPIA
jgi:ketosteroid isomerase-like protein